MRAFVLLCVGFAALLALAGCAQEAVNRIQNLRPGVALPAAQYTPAKDAILVVNGGFGSTQPAGPLVTRWRRKEDRRNVLPHPYAGRGGRAGTGAGNL